MWYCRGFAGCISKKEKLLKNIKMSFLIVNNYRKELSLCQKIVLSLYQGFPLSDCKDVGIRKFVFMSENPFLCSIHEKNLNFQLIIGTPCTVYLW